MTEPTDAEIRELAATGNGVYQDDETAIWEITDPSLMKLVHDALAKWGQPAQAAEPVAWLDPWAGTKVTTDYDAYGKHGIPLYTTPQSTQAQAGAVTDAQVLAAVRVLSPGLFRHGLQPLPNDGANTAAQMRKEADTVRKMLEAALGIKGGQHG